MLSGLRISTDRALLDYEWLFRALSASYWGGHYTRLQILKAADNSLCFGAYLDDPHRQIGFARVITDYAITSTINDVVVDEKWRNMGVGTKLVNSVVEHPAVAPTICVLATRHAQGLYSRFGFVSIGGVMKRDPR